MPLFFFDIYNDLVTEDEDGIEFADRDAAMHRARAEAQNLAAESIREHGHLILDHRIVLRDESGDVVGEVRFEEVVEIKPTEGSQEQRTSEPRQLH